MPEDRGFYAALQEFAHDQSQRGLVASNSKEALIAWIKDVFLPNTEPFFVYEENCATVYVLYDAKTKTEHSTILVEWIGNDSIIGLNG